MFYKIIISIFLIMFLLTGCNESDFPEKRVRGEIINDLGYWQDFIEKYANEHGYEWSSNDSEGIDLENKEIKYEDMSHNIWTSSVFSLEEGWSIDITFSVNSMVEWFDIELKCDKFERYNYNKEYISQVVYLYNELSNYEYSEEKIMQFIEGYAFEAKVDERRDNGWTTEDFYLLKQDLDQNEFSFEVGGWLKIPESSISGDDTKSSQENLPTPRTSDEESVVTVDDGDADNYKIIYDEFCKCKYYEQLKRLQFSPCLSILNRIKEISKDITIKKVSDFSFEFCNITGNNKDIIMTVSIKTDILEFDLLMLFIDSQDDASASVIAQNESLKYQILELTGDERPEIIVDGMGFRESRGFIEIFQYLEREVVSIFDENYSSFQYDISFEVSKSNFELTKTKYYYNTSDKKKKAKKVKYIYKYKDGKLKLENKKTIWKATMDDFKAWTLG